MNSLTNPNDSIERQNEKLRKISQALMRKVEQNTEQSGLAYHQFERAALLETEVQQRTRDLERTLDLLHDSNAQLESARIEAETARSNLTEAIETIDEGFGLFDEDDRLVLYNSRFCKYLKDVETQLCEGLTFEEYVKLVSQSSFLALAENQTSDEWARRRMGKHREEHVVFNVSLVGDLWLQASEHRTSRNGTVILQTDVTEIIRRERLERDRMRQKDAVKLQATLDHLNQGVCIFDSELNLAGTNNRMGQLLEFIPLSAEHTYTFGSLFDQLRSELIFDDTFSAEKLSDWANSNGLRKPISFETATRVGRVYSFFAQEMPDKGFVISVTDVTSERSASRALAEVNERLEYLVEERTSELEDALEEAERANSSKSRFVAAASHDLLQPLSAAKLFVSSISDKTQDDELKGIVSKTETALNGVENLIEALLDISKLDASAAVFDIQTINLSDVIDPLRDEFRQIAMAKGLEFRFVHSGHSVVSDPGYLRRVIQNLLSNAVRYTQHGRVLAGVRRVGTHARVEVWDTGCGIAADNQNEIFREFNQLGTSGSNEGLGLGLAIVERACKRLNHSLEVWSEEGVGSCFSVLLPIAGSIESSRSEAQEREVRENDGLFGILAMLVENNPSVASAVGHLIESQGGEVIHANNAKEALEIFAEVDLVPDVLLLDYQLGSGLNGIELYEMVQRLHGPIPAAIVSADRSNKLKEKCRALDLPLISKPLAPESIFRFFESVAYRQTVSPR